MVKYKLTKAGIKEAELLIGGKEIAESAKKIVNLIEQGKGFLLPKIKLDISHWACIVTTLKIIKTQV